MIRTSSPRITVRSFLSCHGRPERCLSLRGAPMIVCARCFGSYIGHFASVLPLMFRVWPPLWLDALLALPLLLDWSWQRYTGHESTNLRRVTTGVLAGFAVGSAWWWGLSFVLSVVRRAAG
jgi:uncharacterized membrane protein